MERMPHPAALWTANLLVPGLGLVLVGRVAAGAALALVWGATAALVVLGTLVWPGWGGPMGMAGPAAAAGLIYLAAQGLLAVRERALRGFRQGERRDAAFREVLEATLRGRLDEAEAGCRRLLAHDPDDTEAALHLALVARRRGRLEEARRWLRRARFLDETGRWDDLIARQWAALEAEQPAPGRAPEAS